MDWTWYLFRFDGRMGRSGFWCSLILVFCGMILLLCLCLGSMSAFGGEVQILVNDVIAIRLTHVFELDYFQARARRLREFEIDPLQFFRRLLDGDGFKSLDLLLLRFRP